MARRAPKLCKEEPSASWGDRRDPSIYAPSARDQVPCRRSSSGSASNSVGDRRLTHVDREGGWAEHRPCTAAPQFRERACPLHRTRSRRATIASSVSFLQCSGRKRLGQPARLRVTWGARAQGKGRQSRPAGVPRRPARKVLSPPSLSDTPSSVLRGSSAVAGSPICRRASSGGGRSQGCPTELAPDGAQVITKARPQKNKPQYGYHVWSNAFAPMSRTLVPRQGRGYRLPPRVMNPWGSDPSPRPKRS